MTTPLPRLVCAACPALAAVLLLLAAPAAPAHAAPAADPPAWSSVPSGALPFAEEGTGWSYRRFLATLGSRTGVVRLCVVVMCLALFILMRKCATPVPVARGTPRRPDETRNHP